MLFVCCLFLQLFPGSASDSLGRLGTAFWDWRAANAPYSGDDVNRVERPGGTRDWSATAVEKRRLEVARFESRWKTLKPENESIPQQVDYRLVGSALARVRWELDVNPRWRRDPTFYIEQTLTPLAEALIIPAPYDVARSREILTRIENIPPLIQNARQNLARPPEPFAKAAIQWLVGIQERLRKMSLALLPSTTLNKEELNAATEDAAEALEEYRLWLQEQLPSLPLETAIGREAYQFFLRNVALYPFTPEEILAIGQQEFARAVTFGAYENERNRHLPPARISKDITTWIKDAKRKETAIRNFLDKRAILTIPDWVEHYTWRPMPEYLRALDAAAFAELDDFTSASRLKESCVRYVDPPSPQLGFFWRASAQDPRPITVHEGIPGHYFQLCLSWKHEDPLRRFYYDSGANEGIGFYAEEMLLQAGLFDDTPRTREILYTFARLRALRVEVDVKLALGEFSLEQAATYLEQTVPMDRETARIEAAFFATTPGQAIAYQIGKFQIIQFLAEAKLKEGDKFSLRAFHDFVWKNGNVPIALQRCEYFHSSEALLQL